jgi:lysophospholipase L1-like esterase
LDWLAASPAKAIVLYNAPMSREWQADPAHAVDLEMEQRFADRVGRDAARHAKVHFVDFVRNPPPELDRTHFADHYHLNATGAALFTRRLAALLADSGWIAPRKPAG